MDLDLDGLDSDDVQGWIETVRQTMDTTGIEDDSGVGTWMLKAEGLSVDEQHEFSRVIDELASWFNWKFWGNE